MIFYAFFGLDSPFELRIWRFDMETLEYGLFDARSEPRELQVLFF